MKKEKSEGKLKLTKEQEEEVIKKGVMAMTKIIERLEEENKKLKKYYDRDKEELMESCYSLAKENDKLKSDLMEDMKEITKLEKENKNLKERIDVLYEFIERNDKLVDEVIDEEDLDKLNRYIYIDDDLVDRTLESED